MNDKSLELVKIVLCTKQEKSRSEKLIFCLEKEFAKCQKYQNRHVQSKASKNGKYDDWLMSLTYKLFKEDNEML